MQKAMISAAFCSKRGIIGGHAAIQRVRLKFPSTRSAAHVAVPARRCHCAHGCLCDDLPVPESSPFGSACSSQCQNQCCLEDVSRRQNARLLSSLSSRSSPVNSITASYRLIRQWRFPESNRTLSKRQLAGPPGNFQNVRSARTTRRAPPMPWFSCLNSRQSNFPASCTPQENDSGEHYLRNLFYLSAPRLSTSTHSLRGLSSEKAVRIFQWPSESDGIPSLFHSESKNGKLISLMVLHAKTLAIPESLRD